MADDQTSPGEGPVAELRRLWNEWAADEFQSDVLAMDLAERMLAHAPALLAAADGSLSPAPPECEHLSATGIDQADGPDKVWRCDGCGWLYRVEPVGDGTVRLVSAASPAPSGEGLTEDERKLIEMGEPRKVETVERWSWVQAIDDKAMLLTRGMSNVWIVVAWATIVTGLAAAVVAWDVRSVGSVACGIGLLMAHRDLRALHAAIGRMVSSATEGEER